MSTTATIGMVVSNVRKPPPSVRCYKQMAGIGVKLLT
jgi:hypothetical protein